MPKPLPILKRMYTQAFDKVHTFCYNIKKNEGEIPMHEHHDHHHHDHDHCHEYGHDCGSCGGCQHTPMEELMALMQYMVGHNAAHARELADLASQLEKAGNRVAYEQVMAAVSDFEKGNLRLSTVLASLK